MNVIIGDLPDAFAYALIIHLGMGTYKYINEKMKQLDQQKKQIEEFGKRMEKFEQNERYSLSAPRRKSRVR